MVDAMQNTGEEKVPSAEEVAGQQRKLNLVPVLGAISALMLDSPMHQHLFINDLKWLVVPPLRLQQFRLFQKDGMPVAFISWAFLDGEIEERVATGHMRLRPDEWNRGDRPWLVDIIAPFGGQDDALQKIKETVFPEQQLKFLQFDRNSGKMVPKVL